MIDAGHGNFNSKLGKLCSLTKGFFWINVKG